MRWIAAFGTKEICKSCTWKIECLRDWAWSCVLLVIHWKGVDIWTVVLSFGFCLSISSALSFALNFSGNLELLSKTLYILSEHMEKKSMMNDTLPVEKDDQHHIWMPDVIFSFWITASIIFLFHNQTQRLVLCQLLWHFSEKLSICPIDCDNLDCDLVLFLFRCIICFSAICMGQNMYFLNVIIIFWYG